MRNTQTMTSEGAVLPAARQPVTDPDGWLWTQTCAWAQIASLTRKLALGPDAVMRDQLRDAIRRLTHAHSELAGMGQPTALMHCAAFVPGRIEFAFYALAPDGRVALCVDGAEGRVYRFDVCSPVLHETMAPLLSISHDAQEVPR
ncbi:hypothetical protein [Burkholderia sp. SCN-KJ]|uniref:hypothetical protein n=1 Tax=Burkholderia sp. SCN-KJ TaxID=2969248 RepID=UPI00214FA5AC|nr:hypothetical protein [Burkholderia sp. SCN-KJ]MCR4471170.1 hypothetical protein [Burkholderia sp. SCN-KJ]